jgi:hypothetical protein
MLTMTCLLTPRTIWCAVGAIVFKVAVVLMLVNCFLVVDHAPSVTQASWGIGGSPLEEASRYAQDLSEQCAQRSLGFSLPLVLDPLLSPEQHSLFLFWFPVGWAVLFVALFSPSRLLLIRPSADDDPFHNCSSL